MKIVFFRALKQIGMDKYITLSQIDSLERNSLAQLFCEEWEPN
jgi:hypothetical protein